LQKGLASPPWGRRERGSCGKGDGARVEKPSTNEEPRINER
jgi:hypothetical protein